MNYQEFITDEFKGSKLEATIRYAELPELNDIIESSKKAIIFYTQQKNNKQADYYREAVKESILKRVMIKS